MQRRILHPLAVWLFVSAVACPISFAQTGDQAVQANPAALSNVDPLAAERSLQEGYALERKRLWADALVHYEQATRSFPDQATLKERLQIVRIRFDLSRRYADGSFVDSANRLSVSDAMDLYNEVLLKIQSHYVGKAQWQKLVQRGNRNVEVALRDENFVRNHNLRMTEEDNRQFVLYLFQQTNEHQFSSRADAHDLVLKLAQVAESQRDIPAVAMILEYVCGATSALDEYSTFLTSEQLNDVYSQIEGNFVGLGIELKSSGGSLLITNVIGGGPADLAGVRDGDRIVEVDNMSMKDMSTEKAADLLKGEQGSFVQIAVESNDGSTRRLNVRRDRVEVPSVENVKLVDKESGIAYVKLTSFQKTTSRDIDKALWKLYREGMQSLIVDVRGNPGGLLTQAVEIADKFITDGTIVFTRGRSPREDFDYKAHRVGTWQVSLVVLIDGDSASASEIFAGAIRDHRRGKVVGGRSYGKGSVQGIFPLRIAKTGVRLTTAKFYSPSGQAISDNGVQPDVAVRNTKPSDASADPVLSAGIEVARQQLARRTN